MVWHAVWLWLAVNTCSGSARWVLCHHRAVSPSQSRSCYLWGPLQHHISDFLFILLSEEPHSKIIQIQWNPSCEATHFAPEKWSFKRGRLSSEIEINTFMFRFTLSSGLSRGVGLSSGWPLKRGSTVYH